MKYSELYDLVMPPEKRKSEFFNVWVAWVVRPLSILLTIPFINSKVSPTAITKLSVWMVIFGVAICFIWPQNRIALICAWNCFFIWAILDGVDGNLARATNQCSINGELWDAIGGYFAMSSMYFVAGVISYHDTANLFQFCEPWWLLVLSGATALFSIFPRLVMHKKEVISFRSGVEMKKIVNKKDKSLVNIASLNLLSASGFFQVFFLVGMLTHTMYFFVLFYFVINLGMMLFSIRKMVK